MLKAIEDIKWLYKVFTCKFYLIIINEWIFEDISKNSFHPCAFFVDWVNRPSFSFFYCLTSINGIKKILLFDSERQCKTRKKGVHIDETEVFDLCQSRLPIVFIIIMGYRKSWCACQYHFYFRQKVKAQTDLSAICLRSKKETTVRF